MSTIAEAFCSRSQKLVFESGTTHQDILWNLQYWQGEIHSSDLGEMSKWTEIMQYWKKVTWTRHCMTNLWGKIMGCKRTLNDANIVIKDFDLLSVVSVHLVCWLSVDTYKKFPSSKFHSIRKKTKPKYVSEQLLFFAPPPTPPQQQQTWFSADLTWYLVWTLFYSFHILLFMSAHYLSVTLYHFISFLT